MTQPDQRLLDRGWKWYRSGADTFYWKPGDENTKYYHEDACYAEGIPCHINSHLQHNSLFTAGWEVEWKGGDTGSVPEGWYYRKPRSRPEAPWLTETEALQELGVTVDNIDHPDHYNPGPYETIEIIEALEWGREFCAGNVLKYLTRHQKKGGVEDLKKARWYLDRMIEQYGNEESDRSEVR